MSESGPKSQPQKNVVVLSAGGYKPSKYDEAYRQLSTQFSNKNAALVRASITDYDFAKKCFISWHEYQNGTWEKNVGELIPNFIWNKVKISTNNTDLGLDLTTINHLKKIAKNHPRFINTPLAALLIDSKLNQVALFKEIMPKTRFVPRGARLENSEQVTLVTKPLRGNGGKGIEFKAEAEIYADRNFLAQEKLDLETTADYRLFFVGSQILTVVRRTAAADSALTNIAQGGTATVLPPSDFTDLVKICKDNIMPTIMPFQPLIFAADFMYNSAKTPYLIEVNTYPGVHSLTDQQDLQEKFADLLMEIFVDAS